VVPAYLHFLICNEFAYSGCALQPLMSLLFGNLVQDFVNFTVAVQHIDPNDPQSSANVSTAAKAFRHVAAQDASYLTYIGA
jgi:ATP-binding cassette, subfamily B (MDR/TAP), member 1